MTGAGAGHEITGAGAGQEMTGAGAGHETTGHGAGHETGHGAGQATGQATGQLGHGLLNATPNPPKPQHLLRCLADTLESNPASTRTINASAMKIERFVLVDISFLHTYLAVIKTHRRSRKHERLADAAAGRALRR